MRWILGLVSLLIATVVVLSLLPRNARDVLTAVVGGGPTLGEDVTPLPFDPAAAARLADHLEGLASTSALSPGELEAAAATAAGWAKACPPGSGSYRAAVRLRSAAHALLNATSSLDDPHRGQARRLIAEARAALTSPGPLPGGPAAGVKDQLDNLQRAREGEWRGVEGEGP